MAYKIRVNSIFRSILGVLMVSALPAGAMGAKDKHISMSFHMEGEETDGQKMVLTINAAEGRRSYQRMPFLTIEDYESFRPFPAKSGDSFGVLLKLKGPSAERARALTSMSIGKTVLPTVNGRFMPTMKVSTPLNADNRMLILSGLTAEDLVNLEKDIPREAQKPAAFREDKKPQAASAPQGKTVKP